MIRQILFFSFAIFCLTNCNSSSSKKENTSEVSIPVDSSKIYLDTHISFWKEQAQTYYTELLKKFELQEDKVEGGGWYVHKSKKNKNKTHIEVPVSTNGYFYLKTNYCGADWIFHKQVVINIGGVSLYSSSLEGISDYKVQDNNAGYVFESCHLTSPLEDNLLIQAISASEEKEITIRFKGDQKYQDIKLSKEDIKIISECFMLSQFLTVIKNESVSEIVYNKKDPNGYFLCPKGNYPTAEIKKSL